MNSREQGEFAFIDHYQTIIKQSVSEGHDILDEARYCMAPWHVLSPYLFDQNKVNAGRVQPLLEVMSGSTVSIYLAASGAYREAITLLRPLWDMVLIEWYYEAIAKDNPDECKDYSFLLVEDGFNPKQRVPNTRYKQLFTLDKVRDYRQFIQSNTSDQELHDHLLRYVDEDSVFTLYGLLHKYVHAHPGSYNIVQGKVEFLQPFDLEQLKWWRDMFRIVHEAIVLWVQFIYPVMIWSKNTLSDRFAWLGSNEAHPMDVYWSDMLHPLQIEFFSKAL